MDNNKKIKSKKILSLTSLGMMAALAVILGHLNISFPIAPHLQFNLLYVPILIGTFKFGRIFGTICLAITCIIFEMLFGKGFFIGPFMHFAAGFILLFTAGTVYHKNKSKNSAIKGLILGIFAQTLLMIPTNYLALQMLPPLGIKGIMPTSKNSLTIFSNLLSASPDLFIKSFKTDVAFLYCFAIVPAFNLIQGMINSIMTIFIYKKISAFMIQNKTENLVKIKNSSSIV